MSDVGVPWATIVAVGGGILGIVGTALVVMAGMLLKSLRTNVDQRLKALEVNLEEKVTHQHENAEEKFRSAASDVVKLERRLTEYFEAHERLRNKWDTFLQEYLKIDSTRGQKVDALFRIVDQMQDTLRDLRPALNTKIEEMIAHALSELKLYVRDRVREAPTNA